MTHRSDGDKKIGDLHTASIDSRYFGKVWLCNLDDQNECSWSRKERL